MTEQTASIARSQTFTYVQYDEKAKAQQEDFKGLFEKIEMLAAELNPGRAKSLLLTYLEIAYM